jgi:acyl-CoA reductase-like NAD-dependent aldehyde dehydrogenase
VRLVGGEHQRAVATGDPDGGGRQGCRHRSRSHAYSPAFVQNAGTVKEQTMQTTMKRSCLVIGGRRLEAGDGRYFATVDPARGEPFREVAQATGADVDEAIAAARSAYPAWRSTPPTERGRVLLAIAHAIREQTDTFAALETLDTGKPRSQALADITAAARYFEFYGGLADKVLGTTIPLGEDFIDYTLREPLGVSAQIVPWNYPMQIGCRGIAPALAAGNAVVVKPASEAPVTLVNLAELAIRSGVPAGVLNVITGPGSTVGAALAKHPGIDQLTFTGSVPVGTEVMKAAADNVVPLVLELGGKSPNILFADADLTAALPTVLKAILQNAGQTCSAGSRLIVQRGIADEVLSRLTDLMRAVRIDAGSNDPDLGPLISADQLDDVQARVTAAVRDGAELLTGGMPAPARERLGGFFFEPTLVTSKPNNAIAREEVFGPVLAAIIFDDEDQAVAIANDTEYGLVAGVWTSDVRRAHVVARQIVAGQVYVNGYGAGGGVELPFGGFRKSGFGREKGVEGISSYLQTKNVCVRLA